MGRPLALILSLILLLTLLCACTPAQSGTSAPMPAEPLETGVSDVATPSAEAEAEPETPEADDQPLDTAEPSETGRVLRGGDYAVQVHALADTRGAYTVERRAYAASDGVTATGFRATGTSERCCLFEQTVAEAATLRYYDAAEKSWHTQPLEAGEFYSPVVYLETEAGENWMMVLPRTFLLHENDTKEYLPDCDGLVRAEKTDEGFSVTVEGRGLTNDGVCDALILSAPFALLDWDEENCATAWVYYLKNGASMWCFDGYYRQCPSNYIPTGTNYYYCCAASYTIKGILALTPSCKAAAALTVLMLDTMALRQNSYGYWATEPGSEWLLGDYGIGAGFYDTRFNTDLIEIYIQAEQQLGRGMFADTIACYVGFYIQIANSTHVSTENGGWLIPDYWCPGSYRVPHTSLNHQASECLALYHLADLLEREDLRGIAERMLLAIEDTGSGWVMENHNLYYSILPDGTYLEGDYPYLTYNDLYALQAYLKASGEPENEAMTALMAEKLQWMQANGVTGYQTDDA